MAVIQLVPIGQSGEILNVPGPLSDLISDVIDGTVTLYKTSGFVPPWTGYLALLNNNVVGTCAFKTPPSANAVEIAYFTFPDFEGQGIATAMARDLVRIAQTTDSGIRIKAQTMPESNASTAILRKIGFSWVGTVIHPEDGEVWEWQL
ncbi:GNAT family N-acetyltransferase [Spirosoma sp. BT702]|uniref:GNAT family N-acetyltransferase n=1 Tax=Spirosoma profusum TaxID=2771354 RepID=A0A927AQV8_9BACT|nr:GNAT family N-acetyltransferase [Spirosoma profusum]MBD2701308.1 GNAT family N-acetyltransferase [Spirosoma profusum]